jgi:hypothetical protein
LRLQELQFVQVEFGVTGGQQHIGVVFALGGVGVDLEAAPVFKDGIVGQVLREVVCRLGKVPGRPLLAAAVFQRGSAAENFFQRGADKLVFRVECGGGGKRGDGRIALPLLVLSQSLEEPRSRRVGRFCGVPLALRGGCDEPVCQRDGFGVLSGAITESGEAFQHGNGIRLQGEGGLRIAERGVQAPRPRVEEP